MLGLSLLAAMLLLAPPAPAHADSIETNIEKFLGQQAAQVLADGYGTDRDPALVDWVHHISERVSAACPRKDVHYRVQIIDMDEPNAMALPGGYIFVTKGLLEFVQDDDELAAVIGHECGHVVGRHGMSHIKHQIVASLLISYIGNKGGDYAAAGASLVDALFTLQRSRHDELAADQMGAEYAARSGYDPAGLISFFRKIQEAKKPSWLENIFATHPPAQTRIAKMQECKYLKSPTPEELEAIGDRLAGECRYNRALEKYRAAQKLRPEDRDLDGRVADVLIAQGKRQEAVALRLRAGLPMPPPGAALAPDPVTSREESEPARQAVAGTLRDLNERQRQLQVATPRVIKKLRRAWDTHQWTSRLQTAMVGNPADLDYRWLYIAARCAMLTSETERLLGGGFRVMRLSPGAMSQACSTCLLGSQEPKPGAAIPRSVLCGIADEMERAGVECQRSMEETERAVPAIEQADHLVAGVLADLNTPYFLHWQGTLTHVSVLEGFLDLAMNRLSEADDHLAIAARCATRARARAERAGIDLIAATATPEERAVFYGVVRTRLSASDDALHQILAQGESLGDAAVMLLYNRSTSQPVERLEAAHCGGATWIEAAEKMGLSIDTQAIILRLLHNTLAEERIHA